jgi:hypothetical protein
MRIFSNKQSVIVMTAAFGEIDKSQVYHHEKPYEISVIVPSK